MDEGLIRANARAFKKSIDEFYDGNGLVCYASKAFCCKEMCRIMHEEGIGLDVVSGGELYTAINSGFPTNKICFHGNNKVDDELTLAISHGVQRIVVDNIFELKRLNELAIKLRKKVGILLRIKPGIDAHTHDFIRTGQIDSKFGFALETGEAFEAVQLAINSENLELSGLHCVITSYSIHYTKLYDEIKNSRLSPCGAVKCSVAFRTHTHRTRPYLRGRVRTNSGRTKCDY